MDNNKTPKHSQDKKDGERKYTKGFYAAFALCLIAIAATGIYTYSDVTSYTAPNSATQPDTKPVQQAEANVSGVTVPPSTMPPTAAATENKTEPPTAAATAAPTENATKEMTTYYYPVNGDIIKGFSENPVYNETLKDWRIHSGIDIAAQLEQTVKAADTGTIENIKTDDLFGSTVIIRHNSGITATYSGVTPTDGLKKGDHVSAGDTIGTVSQIPCEAKEKPHIHLEIQQGSSRVNPLDILAKNDTN